MEVSDDSGDNTPLCWINYKTDVLEDVVYIDPELDLKPDLIQYNTQIKAGDLLKVPVIYTTKLEEMNVFKRKFDDINMQCFTERVYQESKPKYIRASFETEQKRSHRRESFLPSPLYDEMEKKISAINKKCVSENFGKPRRQYSAKTMQDRSTVINTKIASKIYKFKDMSVVLKDFRKTKGLPLKPKYAHALRVKDKQLNTIDIFITTEESKITQHYNFVCGESLHIELTTVRLSEHVVCCWYSREEFFLSQNSDFNHHNNVVRLGRRPHGCVQNKCKCCCKHQQSVVSDSANESNLPNTVDTAIQNLKEYILNSISKTSNTASNSFTNICSKGKPSNSPHKLIVETLNYNKPLKQKQICGLTYKKKDNLKEKLIHLTNTKTKELEFYELDNDGNVCAHAQFKERTVAHDYLLDFNKPKIVANICCWVKREIIISKLITKQLSDSAIKFIRRPHTCFPGKCICCCYAGSNRNMETLLDISLNKGDYSLNFRMSDKLPKIVSITSGKNFNDNIPTVNETMTEKATLVQKINRTQHVQVSEQHNKVNTSQSNLSNIDTKLLNLISTSDTNQKLSQCLNLNAIIERSCSKLVESVETETVDSTTKQRIVTAIVNNFRNARLTINNEGNVAAALNTPASTLSTIELKFLAHILSSAQNEVNNVLRSNSSEGNEGNTGMTLNNSTQIEDRYLNITEQNPVREAITDKAKTMTPPLMISGESLPSNIMTPPLMIGESLPSKIMTPPLMIGESLPSKIMTPPLMIGESLPSKIITPPLLIGESLPTLVDVDKNMLSDLNYIMQSKQNQLQNAFRSFNNNLYYERDTNETTKIPQIQNVYSLNDKQKSNNDQTDASSSATMWYIEPKKKEPPQYNILQNILNSDLSSSRSLLKYKSSRELKRKLTETLSETETPVKILNSSISDTDTNSKTGISRYQIISSNDSRELESPNDIRLVKSNKKKISSQFDSSPAIPANTLPTQSNLDTSLNTPNPKVFYVLPNFTEHPVTRLNETQQRNEVQVIGAVDLKHSMSANSSGIGDNLPHSTLNFQNHITYSRHVNEQKSKLSQPPLNWNEAANKTVRQCTNDQKILVDLNHTMGCACAMCCSRYRPIAPKPMISPHDTSFRIIVPTDTPVTSEKFSSKKINRYQRNGAISKKSSTKIETKSVDTINVNETGDTEVADQDVEFVIKIGGDNVNVKMPENVDDSAGIATIADGSVNNEIIHKENIVNKPVDKPVDSVIDDIQINDDDECILGV